MAIIKCKMCGGDLNLVEGASTAECEFCGSVQTIPKVDDEKKLTLFARANRLHAACEFDKAAGIYETIVADFPEEAEAYWGLVLCKYGIEYVDDPATAKKVPTCHRSSFESIMEDSDFEQALENADSMARRVYREEAKQIEEIRKGIIAVSANEEPYDIFICYKETAENGDRTLDSVLAQDVYDALNDKGYRVFFSRITLEDKLGVEYEPYIFAALNSAKIMLAFGTDYEYFNAVWVKNEWSRYLKLMAKDKSKHLIPCYKGIDAYDMPKEFARLQAQDLGKVGATQDLLRGIEKILPRQQVKQIEKETVVVREVVQQSTNAPVTDSLQKRAFMFLSEGEWDKANEYCEKVLDIDPECTEAYLGKLMAELHIKKKDSLKTVAENICEKSNFKKALLYAKEPLKSELLERQAQEKRLLELEKEGFKIKGRVLSKYTGSGKRVVIPEEITAIGSMAFYCNKELEAITLHGGIVSIEASAFESCENLRSITIPAGVKDIGEDAFAHCYKLETISLSNTVTSLGRRAFFRCDPGRITIPNTLTELGESAFGGCMNLTDIRIGEDHPRYRVVNNCIVDHKTKELVFGSKLSVIPGDGSVTRIGDGAFCGMDDLSSVTIPECVTGIGKSAFCCCGFTTVKLPKGITDIGERAFSECEELVRMEIPRGVTVIKEHAFAYCPSLKSVEIPDTVTCIETGAFSDCESLKTILIPASVTQIGDNVFSAFLSDAKVTICTSMGSAAWNYAKKNHIPVQEDEMSQKLREEQLRQKKERLAACRDRFAIARKDILAVGEYHAIGLKSDGTVQVVGKDEYNRCAVGQWRNIVAVAVSDNHTIGLKEDGTVAATAHTGNFGSWDDRVKNGYVGQCDVNDWKDVKAIAAGKKHTLGLKSDGTVVATHFMGKRNDNDGQCQVSEWTDIVAIAAHDFISLGLKSDGTVVTTWNNLVSDQNKVDFRTRISAWQDVVEIAVSRSHVVGLKSDGTVVAEAYVDAYGACEVGEWTDIISVAAGECFTVGLKADGTVVATEWKFNPKYYYGSCDVSEWSNIVAIAAGKEHTFGLRADGTVLVAGEPPFFKYLDAAKQWKLFNNMNTLEQERQKAKEDLIASERRATGLCQHCGGPLKGLFSKKCTNCGKAKDY